jgi:eight-cysteine-cluster-containing protein
MATRSILVAAGVLLGVACVPETDRERYQVDEPGTVRFHNPTLLPLYLEGCSHFEYERQVDDRWVPLGPATICVWEGLAGRVAPDEGVVEPIETREPGTWRLRYRVGIGCSTSAPLSEAHCEAIGEVTSNAFEVVASGCVVSGCSGQVCADEPRATTCEWLPHYACFRQARCGRFGPDGACRWEPTPELLACLEDPRHAAW